MANTPAPLRPRPIFVRAAVTMLIVGGLSLIGPAIQAYDRSLFDVYEMAGVLFIPIAYILIALSLHGWRSKRLPVQVRQPYGLLLSGLCLSACAMSIIATLGSSPGGPEGLRQGMWLWLGLCAIFTALLSYRLEMLLAKADYVKHIIDD